MYHRTLKERIKFILISLKIKSLIFQAYLRIKIVIIMIVIIITTIIMVIYRIRILRFFITFN